MSRLASLGVRVPSLHADREVMTPLLLQGTPAPGQFQKWAEECVPPLSSLHLYHLPLLTAKYKHPGWVQPEHSSDSSHATLTPGQTQL